MEVAVPQVVQLARTLPTVFQGSTPLSVDEAYTALYRTDYAQTLRLRNDILRTANIQEAAATPDLAQGILAWEAVGLAYGQKQVLKDIH